MPAPAKIDRLPAELRAQLERLLLDRAHGGYEALSAWLAELGFDIGKSSVHRYDQRLQRSMQALRASAEAARLIAAGMPDEADEHTAAVIRLVQSSLFEAMLRVREAEDADPADQVKLLSQAAQAVAQVGRASIAQKRWQDEVRARIEAIETEAKKTGKTLDAATLATIREGLYGG